MSGVPKESTSLLEAGESGHDGLAKRRRRLGLFGLGVVVLALVGVGLYFLVAGQADLPPFRKLKTDSAESNTNQVHEPNCGDDCTYALVESIPYGINTTIITAYQTEYAWGSLFDSAEHTIDIACMYITLNSTENGTYWAEGQSVGEGLLEKLISASKRGVKIRIAEAASTPNQFAPADTNLLVQLGVADVRYVNFSQYFGSGILHTKLIIIDGQVFYVGSANMDWRSLTQVKELGIVINCSCLAKDATRLFEVYWSMSGRQELPKTWSTAYTALYYEKSPASLLLNGTATKVFLSSSPAPVCAARRTYDLDALLYVVEQAKANISISVMDYFPSSLYTVPLFYWDDIDAALRKAAFNGVQVRLMASLWNYTEPHMVNWLQSLGAVPNVTVKVFEIPPQPDAPVVAFTRVNHAKYMVTDNHIFIGTSNWSADYFLTTAGVSFVATENAVLISELQSIFNRDWESPFARDLPPCPTNVTYQWA